MAENVWISTHKSTLLSVRHVFRFNLCHKKIHCWPLKAFIVKRKYNNLSCIEARCPAVRSLVIEWPVVSADHAVVILLGCSQGANNLGLGDSWAHHTVSRSGAVLWGAAGGTAGRLGKYNKLDLSRGKIHGV